MKWGESPAGRCFLAPTSRTKAKGHRRARAEAALPGASLDVHSNALNRKRKPVPLKTEWSSEKVCDLLTVTQEWELRLVFSPQLHTHCQKDTCLHVWPWTKGLTKCAYTYNGLSLRLEGKLLIHPVPCMKLANMLSAISQTERWTIGWFHLNDVPQIGSSWRLKVELRSPGAREGWVMASFVPWVQGFGLGWWKGSENNIGDDCTTMWLCFMPPRCTFKNS